jgi:hypothetical protein
MMDVAESPEPPYQTVLCFIPRNIDLEILSGFNLEDE